MAQPNRRWRGPAVVGPAARSVRSEGVSRGVPFHANLASVAPHFRLSEEVLRACRNEHAGDERSRNSQYSLAHVMEPRLLHHPQRAPSLQKADSVYVALGIFEQVNMHGRNVDCLGFA